MAIVHNYGARNGVSTVIKYVQLLCKIYTKYAEAIISYIQGSGLPDEQKTTLIDWLNLATTACAILMTLKVTYE